MGPGSNAMKIRIHEDVLWRKVGDEILISDAGSETIFGLDGAGARMWQLIAEDGSIDAAVAVLAAEFDAAPDAIAADLNALIQDLLARGLVEVEQSADTSAHASRHQSAPKRRASR